MQTTKQTNRRALLFIHFSVLLFGLSGVIGRGVSAPAFVVTFGRVFFSSLILWVILRVTKTPHKIQSKTDFVFYVLAGLLMAVHWTTFMHTAQIASVAIATITFSTFPLFVTFLEPLLYKEKLLARDIFFALLMLLGVFVLAPLSSWQTGSATGIFWGMISSLTYALLSLCNRHLSQRYDSKTVCFYEQGIATLFLLPFMFFVPFQATGQDFILIFILGALCTAFAHNLFVKSLQYIRVQTAGIISSMETVYGILLALLFLREMPTLREIIGGTIILGVTILSTYVAEKETESLAKDA